jgi:magnesium chelatase family protein
MLINIHCAKCIGIDAVPVTVEINISAGLGIHLVGLADAAVKESLLRTITALQSLGFRIPGKKIVINLAPADMHKKGSGYDVPIALGIIAASGQRELPLLEKFMVMGELGLDGGVRGIPGALPIAELATREGLAGCILPSGSAMEASEYSSIDVYGVDCLEDVLHILSGEESSDMLIRNRIQVPTCTECPEKDSSVMDFSEIIGQEAAKRGLEIAAAGGHNAILIGSPGSGKSSLAKAMAGILPPMSLEESLQTSKIYSVAGKGSSLGGLMKQRPFRAPHYSASMAALIGGGTDNIMPGEISLAHNGILFADEFCEMPKKVMEALRGPMEDRKVTISRLKSKVEYPADFMLVAATNPCPCGYYGEGDRCTCTPAKRLGYMSKLSGPIMDRIDIQLIVSRVDARRLVKRKAAESSALIAARVLAAREIQKARFADEGIFCNAAMDNRQIERYCPLSAECQELLERIIERMELSARACSRIIKLARTIADLAGLPDILPAHLSEAASYRFLDKQNVFEV